MSVQIDGSTGNIIATKADYSGDVSIGGTLTYEDVTNIDSVGLITARSGVKFGESGTTVFGNSTGIGIGEASPTRKLVVAGDTNTVAVVRGATNGTSSLFLGDSDDEDIGALTYNHPSNYLAITVNASERARIDSSGNLKLGSNTLVTPNTDADNFVIDTGDVDSGISILSATTGRIYFGDAASNDQGSIRYVHTDNSMRFETNSTEKLRIDSSGNMGLGTNSPSALLHISKQVNSGDVGLIIQNTGTSSQTASLYLNKGSGGEPDHRIRNDGGGNLTFSRGTDESSYTEQMRIDSSGRLLVGTTTEGYSVADNLTIADSGNCGVTIRSGSSSTGSIYFSDATSGGGEYDGYIEYSQNSRFMRFGTATAERARITSGGNLLVNRTTNAFSEKLSVENAANVAFFNCTTNSNVANMLLKHGYARDSQSATQIQFLNSSQSVVGSIQSTNSATSYNTSSDYRLKENVVDLDGAIARVKQLSPKRFNFIADADTTVDGFLAHEAQTVVPEAVTGTHNEVDSDNNPVYQGIDTSKLVPLLTAALQEAIAEIETLKTKVAALEG